MSKKYFGTDGIRGVAGEPPLDPASVFAIGLALGEDLGPGKKVLLGEDTRASSRWIAETLAAGLHASGIEVAHAGVIPTPGVAYLVRTGDFAAGVMISASHNPFADNGIKVFAHSGYKLPDAEEAAIEVSLEKHLAAAPLPQRRPVAVDPALHAAYVTYLASLVRADFSRLKIVADCAHGAASGIAAELFARLGLAATVLSTAPDGRNINDGVGALHPEALAAHVVASGADAGIALDGDADRAILVDARGAIVNGDAVLLMCTRALQAEGRLAPSLIVGTLMTNLGLEIELRSMGVELVRTPVGDKYVLEAMLERGAVLGGEPSGHIIFGADATTGDGLLTALRCFELMARTGRPMHELCDGWTVLPQKIVNVKIRERVPLAEIVPLQAAIRQAETHFGSAGRILVRYSGTEKLARVMVEAQSASDVAHHAEAIAQALRNAVGC